MHLRVEPKLNNIKIKVVRGKEGLSSIREDWQRLTESMANKEFFQLYQWHRSYIDTIENSPLKVYFILMYQNRTLIAVFPLKNVTRKFFGFKFNVLEVPDHDHIDLSDFIYKNRSVAQKTVELLVNHLRHSAEFEWDCICLPHYLEDSPTFSYCEDHSYSFVLYENNGRCDYLMSGSYEEMQLRFSKNFRGNLRKARNKLLCMKNVQFVSTRDKIELNNYYGQFLDVESSGWKGKDGSCTAIKLHPELESFYSALIDNFLEINGCEINLLQIDKKSIAAQFCLIVDDTLYVLKIGHDEKYSKIAPGNMLLENLIEKSASDDDIKKINLISGSPWHTDWMPEFINVFRMYIFNKTVAGLFAYYTLKSKRRIRLIYQKYIKRLERKKNKT